MVILPVRTAYTPKDQAKASQADSFIGQGSPKSSTNAYRIAFGGAANKGRYQPGERVFVSAEGHRPHRVAPPYAELQRAVNAGVIFITDTPEDRARPYNIGERDVEAFLRGAGYTETSPGRWTPGARPVMSEPRMGTVEIGNVKTLRRESGATAVYVGRGRAPDGLEHAHLGNPFVVGPQYAQGEAAAAYLPWLREQYRKGGDVRRTLETLAQRVRGGEHLVLVCWCDPKPCHAQHIKVAVLGIAARDD